MVSFVVPSSFTNILLEVPDTPVRSFRQEGLL